MDSDDNFIVGCVHESHLEGRFFLSVMGGTNVDILDPNVTTGAGSFFDITVTPPVSITCVLELHGENLTSEKFTLPHYGESWYTMTYTVKHNQCFLADM